MTELVTTSRKLSPTSWLFCDSSLRRPFWRPNIFMLSLNLRIMMAFPRMSQQCGGNAGYGSDCWLDPCFWGRNKLYFLDNSRTHPGTLTVPLLCQGQISHGIWNDLVRADSQHQQMRVLSWLQSNYRSLRTGPMGQSFTRSFRKPTICVSKPDFPFRSFSKALQNDTINKS